MKFRLLSTALMAVLLLTGCLEDNSADSDGDGVPDTPALYTDTTAYTLTEEIIGLINEVPDHTEEIYKITLSKTGVYTLYMETLPGTADSDGTETHAYVYDEYGTELVDLYASYNMDAVGEWNRKTFEALNAGDYYIRINRDYNIDTVYTFKITAP